MRATLVAAGLVLAGFGLVLAAGPAPDAKPQEVKILQQWQGLYPVKDVNLLPEGQRAAGTGFMADAKTFAAVWKAWKGNEKLPEVDFQKHLVVFARNVQYLNVIRIGGILLKDGVVDVVAMETMSATPIDDKLHMSAAVIAREGVKAVRAGDATVAVPPPDAAKAPAPAEPFVITLNETEAAQAAGPVAVGRRIEVRLPMGPDQTWLMTGIRGAAVKNADGRTSLPGSEDTKKAGWVALQLEAAKAGTGTIALQRGLSREGPQPPPFKVTLTIEVQAAEAKPEGKVLGVLELPARRVNPVPIGGKADPRAPAYIVLLENNVEVKAEVARLEKRYGFTHTHLYDMHGFKGFAAVMTEAAVEGLRWEPAVKTIEHDGVASATDDDGMGIR
jgi:hypothetical protein